MKSKWLKLCAVLVCALAVCSVISLSTVTHSQNGDPLITLSYLNEIVLPQFKTDILGSVDMKLNGTYDPAYSTSAEQFAVPAQPVAESAAPAGSSSSYTLLELTYGQCVYSNSPLEIIVRPGSEVNAISPFVDQGIADISRCTEYLNGERVEVNSYCIIPRGGDGRGIFVNNEKSYILVRGEYYIG